MMPAVSAMPENTDHVVLYENTYDNGRDSAVNAEDEYGGVTYSLGGTITSEFEGNIGFGATEGAYPFRAISYALAEPLGSGVLMYSFDVSKLDRASAAQAFHIRLNNAQYVFYGRDTVFRGPKDNLAEWGDSSAEMPYEVNKSYHVQQIYDLNNLQAHTYIDGELLSTRTIRGGYTVETVDFYLSMTSAYFDNLKIEYYKEMPMEVQEISAQAGGNEIVLSMTDGINTETLPYEGYTVKDLFSGASADASAEVTGSRELTLTSDLDLEEGGAYLVTLPAIEGLAGSVVTQTQVEAAVGSGRYLTGLRLIDCYGVSHYLSNTNPAEVKTLALKFADGVSAEEAAAGLLIEGSGSGALSFTISQNPENAREVFVQLEDYLSGSSVYTITLGNGLDRNYEISLTTAEGIVTAVSCTFTDDGGNPLETLDPLADGAVVTMTMQLVKTVPEQSSVLASYSLWNGLDMNGFDFQTVQMEADETETTVTFEITVEKARDAVLKGFLWKGLAQINPLSAEFMIQ